MQHTYELRHKRKPTVAQLKVFGSVDYAHLDKQQITHAKILDRAIKALCGIYIPRGAYQLYDPKSKRISHFRSVIFKERTNLDSAGMTHPVEGAPDVDDYHQSCTRLVSKMTCPRQKMTPEQSWYTANEQRQNMLSRTST